MISGYFRRLRSLAARRFHQHVRVDGERAMDNLMGTMIGVLFLSVISVSFAGVFMAYTLSTSKAEENSARMNIITKDSSSALSSLYVEANIGKATATSDGWTVRSHNKALSATPALTASPKFANFTYAANRPMVAGGSVQVSQWGVKDAATEKNGRIITLYTAVPKAGVTKKDDGTALKCDWTAPENVLWAYCNVAIEQTPSVIDPPSPGNRWETEIKKYPWDASAFDWSSADRRSVTTSQLGVIHPDGATTMKWVVMFDGLTPGKSVTLDFVEGTNSTIYTHKLTPTLEPGESGTVTRSSYGSVTVPAGTKDLKVFIDTDFASPTNKDQTVQMYRFLVYDKLAN